ncbi:pyridoxal phosphate-dependent aminotransferase [candidate division KSB1 bacterium]|nr:pyridoxal phosphate-dependent aminotransferase [candidate division KSB1 bacterium]
MQISQNKQHQLENEFETRFALRQIPPSKVAEISKATAESICPAEERINLHIGNPVQDPKLDELFIRLVFDDSLPHFNDRSWPEAKKSILNHIKKPLWRQYAELLFDTIEKANPYMPRGGYNPKKPGTLIRQIQAWLTTGQIESLDYSIGEAEIAPEIAITSGGRTETLKLLLQVIEENLKSPYKNIISLEELLPAATLRAFSGSISLVSGDETELLARIQQLVENTGNRIGFIIIHQIYTKTFRRQLAAYATHQNLMLIEMNDAPNADSLARSPGMAQRLLRIITPCAIDKRLSHTALAFVLGNAKFVDALNLLHFLKKGTPSAPEIKLLSFLLNEKGGLNQQLWKQIHQKNAKRTSYSGVDTNLATSFQPDRHYELLVMSHSIPSIVTTLEQTAQKLTTRFEKLMQIKQSSLVNKFKLLSKNSPIDPLNGKTVWEIIVDFFENLENPAYFPILEQAFLAQFLKIHPELNEDFSIPFSGSARGALSLLAESWGLTEVVVPDLSWTVGDAFQKVTAVPLNPDLTFNAQNFIQRLAEKLKENANWYQSTCIVLNNPHNATGKITPEHEIREILTYCLSNRIWVLDDLSYSNVIVANSTARQKLGPIKNCRQIAGDLINEGKLPADAIRWLVTIRSISKTDCKAGSRLCVIEIPDIEFHHKFREMACSIEPNRMALLISYLFYRNSPDKIEKFYALRDQLQWDRMQTLLDGLCVIPVIDNIFGIEFIAPQGAMYPHLKIHQLPDNVKIEELSTKLATRGIGLVPLTTFARTRFSYQYVSRTFRLTLGGPVSIPYLKLQVDRLVRELTLEIQRTAYDYTYYAPEVSRVAAAFENLAEISMYVKSCEKQFQMVWQEIEQKIDDLPNSKWQRWDGRRIDVALLKAEFRNQFLPDRQKVALNRLYEEAYLTGMLNENLSQSHFQDNVVKKFKSEITPEIESERRLNFQNRMFDRTVHPTQSYAIEVDHQINDLITGIINQHKITTEQIEKLSKSLFFEFFAENIAINSAQEADEAILDLEMLYHIEDYANYFYDTDLKLTLSLWGDWDGSRRPSGQGHTLVAGALIHNVRQLTALVQYLDSKGLLNDLPREILFEIDEIEKKINKFKQILRKITLLTTRLEEHYRKHLENIQPPGWFVRKMRKIGLARDPVKVMWKHNDRNERRMRSYRHERSNEILRFFRINYQLSQLLETVLPVFGQHYHDKELMIHLANYKNPLKRFYLTPRIHQKIITAKDSFAIDTTVYNLVEINRMGAMYGYPGLVLSLQVSMTNQAEAIIAVDKKIRTEWERVKREDPSITPVSIRIVPLFEEIEILHEIESFLDKIWEYADESKLLGQATPDRFCEIIGEFFVAGSDLSQQVGQPQAQLLFKQSKARINRYLLKKGLAGRLRIKLGSGEPAQRQGGYYDPYAAQKVLLLKDSPSIIQKLQVDGFTAEGLLQARSPLNGIFHTSDFRTFQSNIMERLRHTPTPDLVNTFYHIKTVQTNYEQKIRDISETYWGSRRRLQEEMEAQLDVLMTGQLSPAYLDFVQLVQKNFEHILYGLAEDMAGIHVVSYFVSRALLSVRDRPTVRPTKEAGEDRGRQIVEHLSGTLPLREHGTLLRAIGHNKAQTMILGINQLTTGLFRAMREFVGEGKTFDQQLFKLQNEILPHLPVKDILNTLRLYHQPNLVYLRRLEATFPPGNSSLKTIYEEQRVMSDFIPYLQTELMRRNGLGKLGRQTNGQGPLSGAALLSIRPDLAVLFQKDIFNIDLKAIFEITPTTDQTLQKFSQELYRRQQIQETQAEIWQFLEEPVGEQVKSFFELARAIKSLRGEGKISAPKLNLVSRSQVSRLGAEVNRMLQEVADDSMRQFLIAAVQYLLYLPETLEDIPEAVLIALRDVQKILSLDEQALSLTDQKYLQFLFIRIARVAGESG